MLKSKISLYSPPPLPTPPSLNFNAEFQKFNAEIPFSLLSRALFQILLLSGVMLSTVRINMEKTKTKNKQFDYNGSLIGMQKVSNNCYYAKRHLFWSLHMEIKACDSGYSIFTTPPTLSPLLIFFSLPTTLKGKNHLFTLFFYSCNYCISLFQSILCFPKVSNIKETTFCLKQWLLFGSKIFSFSSIIFIHFKTILKKERREKSTCIIVIHF